jgi:hypothetical protein
MILSPVKRINTNEDIGIDLRGIVSSSQLRSQQIFDFWKYTFADPQETVWSSARWHADPAIQSLFILMLYRLFGPIRDKAVWNNTIVARKRD